MCYVLPRRTALTLAAFAALAGCASNKPIVLDRQAMVGIKRIGLPTVGIPRSPDVRVLNGLDTRLAGFGLIGAIGSISGSVVRANRSDALVAIMAARGFDPGPALTAMLAADLRAKGFTVVALSADPKRRFLPMTATTTAACDAVLDCYVEAYGFTALSDSDESPYRASIALPARLVGNGGIVLMEDTATADSGSARQPPEPNTPPPPAGTPAPGTFKSFSDVEKDPAVAVGALQAVFEAAAAGVMRRIT